jgi:hypothetical protein
MNPYPSCGNNSYNVLFSKNESEVGLMSPCSEHNGQLCLSSEVQSVAFISFKYAKVIVLLRLKVYHLCSSTDTLLFGLDMQVMKWSERESEMFRIDVPSSLLSTASQNVNEKVSLHVSVVFVSFSCISIASFLHSTSRWIFFPSFFFVLVLVSV